ncbi:MAG: hypothetical protein WA863_16720, partial [Methyloceanibacter sp.]
WNGRFAAIATITIIGATLVTAIAVGETYRLVAASKLVIRFGARAAAHAAVFSLSAVSTYKFFSSMIGSFVALPFDLSTRAA